MGNKKRPENMTDFESILEKNVEVKYKEKWHPISVSSFEEAITQGDLIGIGKELKKILHILCNIYNIYNYN